MGNLKSAFYAMVTQHLPNVETSGSPGRERLLRAIRWLSVATPLLNQVDGLEEADGAPDAGAWAHALASLVGHADDGCQLTIKAVPPAEVAHLPRGLPSYVLLFNRLVVPDLAVLLWRAELRLGALAVQSLRREFLESVGSTILIRLMQDYRPLFLHLSPEARKIFLHGCPHALLAFVLAVILEDEESVRRYAPIVSQLAFGVPMGTTTDDPQRWYLPLPTQSVR